MENASRVLRFGKKCLLGACVYKTITHYVADVWILSERSMEPTLQDGQIVLSCPIGRLNLSCLNKGDVVISRNPTAPKESICKRVVALSGDRVPSHYSGPETFVPAGQVWLEGDNTAVSRDSRTFGSVPLGLIQGRLICRVWPMDFQQPWLHNPHINQN